MVTFTSDSGFSRTAVLAIIAVVLIAGGAVAAFVLTDGFNLDGDSQSTSEEHAGGHNQQNKHHESLMLVDQALDGQSMAKCTYSTAEVAGTVYIQGDKHMRADYESAVGLTHMLKLADSAYVWADDSKVGTKFSGAEYTDEFNQKYGAFNPQVFEQQADATELTCESVGSFDGVSFEVPTDIEFTDAAQMLQQVN